MDDFKGKMMTSSRVSQVVPGSAFSYAMSLRVRHPNVDPAVLTKALHLEPLHCWRAGEPRRSASGDALGGEASRALLVGAAPGSAGGLCGFSVGVVPRAAAGPVDPPSRAAEPTAERGRPDLTAHRDRLRREHRAHFEQQRGAQAR